MAKTAAEKLQDARFTLMSKWKFWGFLALKISLIEDKNIERTAINNKGHFHYNPEWIESLSVQDIVFEFAHEVMHLIQKCTDRFPKGGNFQVWNLAADYLADTYIIADGNGIPPSAISRQMVPESIQKKVKDQVIEEVYRDLMKDAPEQKCQGNCKGNCGEECDGGEHPNNIRKCCGGSLGEGKEEGKFSEQTALEWTQNIIAANHFATQGGDRGSIPGNVLEFIAKITKPTINWKDKIRSTATSKFRPKYSFRAPSRRGHNLGVRLQKKIPTPEGAVLFFDTSGSVSDEELRQAASESVGILISCGAAYVNVYFHDVVCYYHDKYTVNNMHKIKVTRGGTSHIDVFQKAEEEEENIGMVVAFTDLETRFPEVEPAYPVLWCHTKRSSSHSVPWGKKVEMALSQ